MKRGNFKRRDDVKLVASAVGLTRQILTDNEIGSLENVLRLHEGTYLLFCGRYFGALCVAKDAVDNEPDLKPKLRRRGSKDANEKDTSAGCASRINYGILLKSQTPADLNILNVVDLYFSRNRTKLWFPWMDYNSVEYRKGYQRPSGLCGSLYVSQSDSVLQEIQRELVHAEENVKRCMTQEYAPILSHVQPSRYIIPAEGEAEVVKSEAREYNCLANLQVCDSLDSQASTDAICFRPEMGKHNVYLFSGSEDQFVRGISDLALKPILLRRKPQHIKPQHVKLVRPR